MIVPRLSSRVKKSLSDCEAVLVDVLRASTQNEFADAAGTGDERNSAFYAFFAVLRKRHGHVIEQCIDGALCLLVLNAL
jgi:hypothetical protein